MEFQFSCSFDTTLFHVKQTAKLDPFIPAVSARPIPLYAASIIYLIICDLALCSTEFAMQCRDYTLLVYVCSCAPCRDTVMCGKHHVVRLSNDLFHPMTLGCAQT